MTKEEKPPMKYYLVNETEAGLATIKSDTGIYSLPYVLDKPNNIVDGEFTLEGRFIAEVGTILEVYKLPEYTPHQRINYNQFCESAEYIHKCSLLLRFTGNFLR